MFRFLNKILPKYAYLPLMLMLLMNSIAYYGSKVVTSGVEWNVFALPIDDKIPYIPAFISFYILAYVQWVIGYIIIARENRKTCYRVISAEIIAKIICLIIFIVYPTTMLRADASGSGVWNFLTRIIYATDTPVNLFPSIHCLESWVCFRGAIGIKKIPKWYTPVNFVFTLFVFASIVFVKQHLIIDIAGGVVVAEIGFFIARITKSERLLNKIEPKFAENS